MPSGPSFHIEGREIGGAAPPYVVAEMSGNHNGDINRAFALLEAAKTAGADAVKLQTYTADTITIDHDGPGFVIEGGLWHGRKLYDLYAEAHTPWDWHPALFAKGRELGLTVFSTPFDPTAVDLLEELGAPAYKIASFELIDHGLVERVAATGKPLIMSTGMADLGEIADAVRVARRAGCRDLSLLHCVSSYPATPDTANLRTIAHLAEAFGTVPGLSDHTPGNAVAVAGVALGAAVVEKHVTLRRADGGPDAAFSLEPEELAALVQGCRDAHMALGRVHYDPCASEKTMLQLRRSLYVVEDIAAGEPFTPRNLRSIRPGLGLPPRHLPELLGQRAACGISKGTPMRFDLVRWRQS